jgi:hypothetical protein
VLEKSFRMPTDMVTADKKYPSCVEQLMKNPFTEEQMGINKRKKRRGRAGK